MHGARREKQGFTLIELLVVMAIMAIFLGVLGLALSGNGGTVATQTGQRKLTTMISAARSQAILNQTNARLIIHVDPPTPGDMDDPRREKYLRFMAILVREGGGWREINDGVYLPRGVYVVPPFEFDPPGVPLLPTEVISPNTAEWSHDRRTIVGLSTMEYAYGHSGGGTPDTHHYIYIDFGPRGTTNTYTEIAKKRYERRVVVAPATTTADFPRFESGGDSNILGGMIRRNGSFTLVNNPEGLPEPKPVIP